MAPLLSRMVAAAVPVGTLAQSPESFLFKEFVDKFERTYESAEEAALRFKAFSKNLGHIKHFQQVEEGTATYSHLTPFADLSPEEFSNRHGFKSSMWKPSPNGTADLLDVSTLPDDFDWRTKGAVNPVKNQGSCGSCWAFATVANIEGAAFVTVRKLLSLSEQELVDCDNDMGDQGCDGGLPSNAYKDMIQNGIGLELEQEYPYAGRDGQCKAFRSKEVVSISGWQAISQDEDQIAAALISYGPLALGINAAPMQIYFGGIAHPWKFLCNPKSLDHGVAFVGYGVEKGKKFWIIRNSWGPRWGEKGYYRIIRGTGACGLNTMVTTATGIYTPAAGIELVV